MRLAGYDYSAPGAYFITVCSHRRVPSFEDPAVAEVITWAWDEIPSHFPEVTVDEFVVMPNHVHGGLFINDAMFPVGGQHAGRLRAQPHLSVIMRSFKAAVTRELRVRDNWDSRPLWQPDYYDRIIRDELQLNRVREYIAHNPLAWQHDHENPDAVRSYEHVRDWAWLEDHT